MANTNSLDLESGSSQYASIADGSQTGLDLSGDFTVEFWVNFESLPGDGTSRWFFEKGDHDGDRAYNFWINNVSGTYTLWSEVDQDGDAATRDVFKWTWAGVSTGTWYHLTWTYDISEASATANEVFINGASQGNGTAVVSGNPSSINNSAGPFVVGGGWTTGAIVNPFDGKVDDFRVWSDVRSDAEIADNYQKEQVGNEADLVAYWKFNNDYLDETTNNNDLTASGSPVFSTDVPFGGAVSGTLDLTSKSW